MIRPIIIGPISIKNRPRIKLICILRIKSCESLKSRGIPIPVIDHPIKSITQ